MQIKYQATISDDAIAENLKRLSNHIFKILPLREEQENWQDELKKVIIELISIDDLLIDQVDFFYLLTELNSLFYLTTEKDFPLFRKTIFRSLSTIKELIKKCILTDTPHLEV